MAHSRGVRTRESNNDCSLLLAARRRRPKALRRCCRHSAPFTTIWTATTSSRSSAPRSRQERQIEAISFGEEKPKALGHEEAAWAQNRRSDLAYDRTD
jgi:hypothetical protein